jgi:hypothetical protein
MKFSTKTTFLLVMLVAACAEPDAVTPVPATSASTLTADFSYINAVADGPTSGLEFYVNNNTIGGIKTFLNGVPHTTVPITTNGVGANTNIRVKGNIGGVLGASDMIYRAGNNNLNNFVATASTTSLTSRYTLIALDSINRPLPLRKLNAQSFGDTTFYNRANGQYVSTVERKAMTAAQRGNLVAIGTVPLGSSDPGGPRFLLLTDTYPAAALLASTTQAVFRVINASPNAPNLFARIKFVSGAGGNILLPSGTAVGNGYIMAFPGFSPSVGSRATTVAFGTNQTIAPTGIANTYDLEVATEAGFTNIVAIKAGVTFTAGKVYTVVISGKFGKTLAVNAIQQN